MTTAVALDQLCVNTIRTLAIDAVQKASSGHPGLPMGAAPMAYVLWQRHLRHQPQNPDGRIAIASSCRPDTARCCSMLCCT